MPPSEGAMIKELWVYPVKACQGVQVSSSVVTATGLEFDRTWCVVDLEGTHVPKLEAISGRRMPVLATIKVSFKGDMLCLDAPGMSQLRMPALGDSYNDCPSIRVESAGAAGSGTWSLAFLECKMHKEGSSWISKYLNSPQESNKKLGNRLVNGKKTPGKFAIVRSLHDVVDLGKYPPIFPLIEKSKTESSYKQRFEGNYRRLSDFAPFLLVSKPSADFLGGECDMDGAYPTTSFRGNIIVDGDSIEPWAEETWAELEIVSPSGNNEPLVLHTIKQCPRCTVPCRDQQKTGAFLFKSEQLKLWKVLKALYPRKFHDPEWGSWAGAYMGVYMGHHGKDGKIAVGDRINPTKITPWDAHLRNERTTNVLMFGAVLLALVSVALALVMSK